VPQRAFAGHLDMLCRTHDVVPLAHALSANSPGARPRVAITFDDATVGALTAGVEELAKRDLTATVFVAPAFVGGRSFWWDAIPDLNSDIREHALNTLMGKDALVREWAAAHGISLRSVPRHQTCATEEQLLAAEGQGIDFGSHTWSHPNLSALKTAEMMDELTRPMHWLRERFTRVVPYLAYPYGLYSGEVARRAGAAGYAWGLKVSGGMMPKRQGPERDAFAIPRQNIDAGLSRHGFQLRVSGLVGS
jgi:peptidoglycan/xylan/chitin deacetylase (PgdA/CDA1 family)